MGAYTAFSVGDTLRVLQFSLNIKEIKAEQEIWLRRWKETTLTEIQAPYMDFTPSKAFKTPQPKYWAAVPFLYFTQKLSECSKLLGFKAASPSTSSPVQPGFQPILWSPIKGFLVDVQPLSSSLGMLCSPPCSPDGPQGGGTDTPVPPGAQSQLWHHPGKSPRSSGILPWESKECQMGFCTSLLCQALPAAPALPWQSEVLGQHGASQFFINPGKHNKSKFTINHTLWF